MLRHGTTTWEGKSGYGLDRDTELASLRAVRVAGGSPTWLGAHAVPPEFEEALWFEGRTVVIIEPQRWLAWDQSKSS